MVFREPTVNEARHPRQEYFFREQVNQMTGPSVRKVRGRTGVGSKPGRTWKTGGVGVPYARLPTEPHPIQGL